MLKLLQAEVFTEPGDECSFASAGLALRLRDIYRNVRFDESAEGGRRRPCRPGPISE